MTVCQVEGRQAPGPLFDFGLLIFHCGKILFENKSGPFFYLSKVTCTHLLTCNYFYEHNVTIKLQLFFCCSPGGGHAGGKIMEQDLCMDTTEGLHYYPCVIINHQITVDKF